MRVEVMEYYGLTQPFSQAGYYETRSILNCSKTLKGNFRGSPHCGVWCSRQRQNRDHEAVTATVEGRESHYGLQIFVGGKAQYQASPP